MAAAEEAAKYERKVQRAANALRKKQEKAERDWLKAIKEAEKEAVDAANQLMKDLAVANKAPHKAPIKKRAATTKTTKPVPKTVRIQPRVVPRPKSKAQNKTQQVMVVESEGVGSAGVACAKTASRTITLPQRFR